MAISVRYSKMIRYDKIADSAGSKSMKIAVAGETSRHGKYRAGLM
jgi:hypothetical protein